MQKNGVARLSAERGWNLRKAWPWTLVVSGAAVLLAGASLQYTGAFQGGGAAHPLTLRIAGIKSGDGVVRYAVCRANERFPTECEMAGEAKASRGVVVVQLPAVEEGAYAAAAFHDENRNGSVDLYPGRQVPSEGVAFSNGAASNSGVPSFEQARFEFDGKEQRLRMQYMR
jgi:uncharacterized protein (DUF2141 family)